jgi:dolichyl-phosphate-mannose-protein mannosyltransferase
MRNPFTLASRALRHPQAPLWVMGVVSLSSLGTRLLFIDKPVDPNTHRAGLIFDEQYYVNAARVILGIHPSGTYTNIALFHDPNAEHPPLGKLLIAGTMKLFGDNPIGWRLAPIIFGTIAVVAMYWLVRSAGSGRWLAVGAATLLAVDNLMLIHGRIATLDVFVVAFMIVTVALYLRGHPLLAGIALGVGLCTKLVAIDVAFLLILLELGRILVRHRDEVRSRLAMARARAVPMAVCLGAGAVTYLAALFLLDLIVAPIGGPGDCATVAGGFRNPILHTLFMTCYAGKLTSPGGPTGIASYPWQWLLNQVPIDYFTIANKVTSGGKVVATHNIVSFQGEMNPAIIFLAIPGMALALRDWLRQRDSTALLCLAWFVATYLPFLLAGAPLGSFGNRDSYIYYMLIVLPGAYLAVARLFSAGRLPRAVLAGYAAIVAYWFVTLYPFRTWSGS